MKNLIQQLLHEALIMEDFLKTPFKGKNILYHSTRWYSLVDILGSGEIKPKTKQVIKTSLNNDNNKSNDYYGVSFTRKQNYNYGEVKLILDGDLIKQDYGKKMMPYDWARVKSDKIGPKSKPERSGFIGQSEAEEFLVGPLKNVKKYVLGIQLLRDTDLTINSIRDYEPELYKSFKEVAINIPIYDMNFKQVLAI